MNWKNGEKYLVCVTNNLFENFGRVVEVTYKYESPTCFCFIAEDTDNWVEEYYCEDDFVLVDEEVDKQLVKAVMIDVLKMR